VNATPFNSANGIFIELILSSGVMVGISPRLYRSRHSGFASSMHPGTTVISPSNVLEAITCDVKPGNALKAA
jgi:hypothetical protein